MYSLFEVKKTLSLTKPGGKIGIEILLSSYAETESGSVLVLVCENGYLLFCYVSKTDNRPVIRQVPWFQAASKAIKALSFDPSGTWLLLVTFDASLYILPSLPLLDANIKVPCHWKRDDITEIKLKGQRAPLTSVSWWESLQGQHIAIIGSQLGEIAFVNLINKNEVGGTYVTVGISVLDILRDESHDTTYLLITGNNRQQWRLLLEEKKSNFYWPFETDVNPLNDNPLGNKSEKYPALIDQKDNELRPHRLSKFESGTFLTPQHGGKKNLVSAYNATSHLLQVLEGDLDQMHLFSYQVPANCESIILSDKLIFLTQKISTFDKYQHFLCILSRKFAEVSENSKKRESHNAEIQTFCLDAEVLGIYSRSFGNFKFDRLNNLEMYLQFPAFKFANQSMYLFNFTKKSAFGSQSTIIDETCSSVVLRDWRIQVNSLLSMNNLDGCYMIQNNAVLECRLKLLPEVLFLNYTTIPTDLPIAEKLGVMLGLEINKLYEVAAEVQLAYGHFAQAVHLYQLSKCPQLKRIAHFMSYGYLSELIAYIQVLFSTKSIEIVPADKCHFANIALHCFAQQTMEKDQDMQAITIAFKKFLRENIYYDEAVAVKLLAEQELYELLHYLSEVRGQHGLVIETLLQLNDSKESLDTEVDDALEHFGHANVLLRSNNDEYMLCITSFHLLQHLAAKPYLLKLHLQHLITLLPKMDTPLLSRVASLYDISRAVTRLAFRNFLSVGQRQRYWSTGSLTSVNQRTGFHNNDKESAGEDLVKFFIFVLLMLCHRQRKVHFNLDFLSSNVPCQKPISKESHDLLCDKEQNTIPPILLACGQSHSAFCKNGALYSWGNARCGRLGNGDTTVESEIPQPINMFLMLQVKVLAVSCGALHTLALTDFGVFAWGSSRYGQLGIGEVQRASQPVVIESLLSERIKMVECGQYHSLAITSDGRVYSWGWGVHGQLGHGNPEDVNVPKIIQMLKTQTIVSAGAGQVHSILLTHEGQIYTFGCGMFGQLGTGSILKRTLPQRVSIPEPIAIIASSYFHTVAVSTSNKIYVWGCNPQALRLQAQCSRRARQHSSHQNSASSGLNDSSLSSGNTSSPRSPINQQSHLIPTIIDSSLISDPISQISCGSHHSMIITSKNDLYGWGRNMEGQLGNSSRREQKVPVVVTQLNDRKITAVACGADYTIVLDSAGKLWGWGKNDCGQVGQHPLDSTSKSTGPSSGRIITIRTNRRMITITQPCRQSFLQPVEIIIPKHETEAIDFDCSSYESENEVLALSKSKFHPMNTFNVFNLSNYDVPPFGPYALHATLKALHNRYDAYAVLNYCLTFNNFQAAAKVFSLENLYAEALKYHLKSIVADESILPKDYFTLAFKVIEYLTSVIGVGNTEMDQKFLYYVITFWIDNNLPIQPMEAFLWKNIDIFSYALGILLFLGDSQSQDSDIDLGVCYKFFTELSTNFCLNLTVCMIDKIEHKVEHLELLEQMMALSETKTVLQKILASDSLRTWNDSVPYECLWQEILHNIQKGIVSHASLQLTSSEVDILSKSLISEKLSSPHLSRTNVKLNVANSTKDIVVFSCNHHYTLDVFHSVILPEFQESLQKLTCPSLFAKHLLFNFHLDTVIPAACPKCVLIEIAQMA